jgi:hypothetical protein
MAFTAAALLLVASLFAGCEAQGPSAIDDCQRLVREGGEGVHLFGPAPLPRGGEDLGYFAQLPPREETLALFDLHTMYVRTWIWDVENNRHPGQSYHRRMVFSEDIRASYR